MDHFPAGWTPGKDLIDPLIGFQEIFPAASGAADRGLLFLFNGGIFGRGLFFTSAEKKRSDKKGQKYNIFHGAFFQ